MLTLMYVKNGVFFVCPVWIETMNILQNYNHKNEKNENEYDYRLSINNKQVFSVITWYYNGNVQQQTKWYK